MTQLRTCFVNVHACRQPACLLPTAPSSARIQLGEGSLDCIGCAWIYTLCKAPQDDEKCVGSAIIQQRLQIHDRTQLLGQPGLHLVCCHSSHRVSTAPSCRSSEDRYTACMPLPAKL